MTGFRIVPRLSGNNITILCKRQFMARFPIDGQIPGAGEVGRAVVSGSDGHALSSVVPLSRLARLSINEPQRQHGTTGGRNERGRVQCFILAVDPGDVLSDPQFDAG